MVEPVVEGIAEQGRPIEPIESEIVDNSTIQEMPLQAVPTKVHDQPFSGYPMNKQEVYTSRMKRPNPLLEPSSYPQVMGKQLPKYEGLLAPQPIEIELRDRLPSYDVDKAIEKYPFTMDIPSIEELQEKKRRTSFPGCPFNKKKRPKLQTRYKAPAKEKDEEDEPGKSKMSGKIPDAAKTQSPDLPTNPPKSFSTQNPNTKDGFVCSHDTNGDIHGEANGDRNDEPEGQAIDEMPPLEGETEV